MPSLLDLRTWKASTLTPPSKRCASAISDDGVEPTVLVATRFECEMYIGSMARLADHDARSISGLQHVDGVPG